MKTLNWQQKQPANLPDPRTGSAFALNPYNKGSVMLFGGIGGPSGRLNDSWAFDQGDWQKRSETADPVPRSDMGFAYDDNQNVLLLFGGNGNGTQLGDTWIFDGHAWKQQPTDQAPAARGGAKLAFDSQRKVAVLFGGAIAGHRFATPQGDTWLWDGSAWQQAIPETSPGPRSGMCMVYDASRQVVLLFGGQSENGLLNDTWAWDGKTWNALQPAHAPAPRIDAAMVYNPTSRQVILYGGQTDGNTANDTWAWDGQDWAGIETQARPPADAIAVPQMCYLPAQDNVMLLLVRVHKPRTPSKKDPLKVWCEVWVLA